MGKRLYFLYLNRAKKISAVVEMSRNLSIQSTNIAGGPWAADCMTILKARLENNGKLKILVHHNLTKLCFTFSSVFDTESFNKILRIGLVLLLFFV